MQLPLAAVFLVALDRSAATFFDGVLSFGRSKVEAPRLICNQHTPNECECSTCPETLAAVDTPWIAVQFEGCHYAKVNELRIRESVAHWVELQCAWTVTPSMHKSSALRFRRMNTCYPWC
ncbi:hypothetical protein AAVH_04221 [Aphelenchoides avenae]|nr:hypothetical protein AAVH_04221 [Aphelenchus avenae]